MRIHYFQHVPFEGLGCIEDWAKTAGHRIAATRFYLNEPLPNVNDVDWLIVMGGPMNIYDDAKFSWLAAEKRFLKEAIDRRKMVLGICLGAQLLADVLGAKIYANRHKEIGWFNIRKVKTDQNTGIAAIFPDTFEAFHWHGDTFGIPKGSSRIASSDACVNQGFVGPGAILGLQFHLETDVPLVSSWMGGSSGASLPEGSDDGRFIQAETELLDLATRHTETNRTILYTLLDRFFLSSL